MKVLRLFKFVFNGVQEAIQAIKEYKADKFRKA